MPLWGCRKGASGTDENDKSAASCLEYEAFKILEAKMLHVFANRGIQQTERTFVTSLCHPIRTTDTNMWPW